MWKLIAGVVLGLLSQSASAASSFEETARQVIIAFQQKDNAKINALIDKKTGLYVMYKIGVGDEYEWLTKFNVNRPVPEHVFILGGDSWNSEHIPADNEFDYRTQVNFVCEKGWDRAGIFVSYDNTMLSFSMANQNMGGRDSITDANIAAARRLEVLSHRVVAVPEKWDDGLVFHLSELRGINKGWYLTLLDFATIDCSA
ncbi:hypothetical protein ACMYSL_09920 [Klebsiella sp. MISC125]|uniref:hypothetical protein n=1 Tax=Klebsiella sp. MISC125 TaxID=2755386 RepID=UPI003DA997A2